MEKVLLQLRRDFPSLSFRTGERFAWSPQKKEIVYPDNAADQDHSAFAVWSLLHEAGHALLQHDRYQLDIELVMMEAAAWRKATELAAKYDVSIDSGHIQDCLDTYRDWLHRRSRCPQCNWQNLQSKAGEYRCLNCNFKWLVSSSKLCRPYRKKLILK